ncbi:MAG: carboxylating nicotinate-nucleotide diphosphorylase [Polyangiaceae bacterium]
MLTKFIIDEIVDRALAEDLSGEDLTTMATVSAETRARATALAKSELVVCGGDVFKRVFKRLANDLSFEVCEPDGKLVQPGTPVWRVDGAARPILMGERTALNLVQRMSGTATMAHAYTAAVPKGAKTRIVDTRKTTPGLRALERYAVRCGGAYNHRDTLGSAVLIKDNHIEAAGSISEAVRRAKDYAPHTTKIEIEVESLEGLEEALNAGADIVMLDNFAPDAIATAVSRAAGRALIEVSGGITLPRIAELASQGVDVISVGALTHSAPAADISLDIQRIDS